VQLVASTIKAAVQRSASDIHIEPQSAETAIRLRVDVTSGFSSCRLCQKELSGSFVFCPHCGEKTGDEQRTTEVHEEKPEGVMN